MKISYLDAANAEFQKAIDYYNTQTAGLGFEFSQQGWGSSFRAKLRRLSHASEIS